MIQLDFADISLCHLTCVDQAVGQMKNLYCPLLPIKDLSFFGAQQIMSADIENFMNETAEHAMGNEQPTLEDFMRILAEDEIDLPDGFSYSSDSTDIEPSDIEVEPLSPFNIVASQSASPQQVLPPQPTAGCATAHQSKRKDPRIRRKPLETKTLLAQCLLQWLQDPVYNPSAIKWISKKDGLFQITDSATISSLWGSKKGNKKEMNHEKLSRALRHYYKDGTLERMPNKKKLCYKFSSQAMEKFKIYF